MSNRDLSASDAELAQKYFHMVARLLFGPPPSETERKLILAHLRQALEKLRLLNAMPDNPDVAMARRKLRESLWWAVAAVLRKPTDPPP